MEIIELYHYGTKGMRWGIRRYQNKDGSLTAAGKARKQDAENEKLTSGDILTRTLNRMGTLSSKDVNGISSDDRATFEWDVEGIEDSIHWYKNPPSSKKTDDIKRVAKDLDDDYKRWMKEAKDDGDIGEYNRLKTYRDTYMKDTEKYATAVIETIEDWVRYRESDTTQYIWEDHMKHSELYHYGTKGMRWGIRRYQNKDGSLTPAGQKRRDKLQAKLDKVTGADPKNTGKTKLKISDMTDEELGKYIARKRAEKDAYGLERDIANMNPKTVSSGKKFVQNFTEKALSPAVSEAGKKLLTGIMNKAIDKALGDGGAEELAKLKKEVEKTGLLKDIAENNKKIRDAAKKPDDDPMSNLDKRKKEAEVRKAEAEAKTAERNADKSPDDSMSNLEKRKQEAEVRMKEANADKAEIARDNARDDRTKNYGTKYDTKIDETVNNPIWENTYVSDLPSYYNEDWDDD